MRSLVWLITLATITFTFNAQARSSFLPENDLYKEDSVNFSQGITEENFQDVVNYIDYIYGPIIQQFGKKLVIESDWQDSTVNAYAYNDGDEWHVKMFGGLARRKEVTVIGFGLVLAHEICHHIGGFPVVPNSIQFPWDSSGASNEGNSDYCATNLVGKRIFASGEFAVKFQVSAVESEIDPLAKARCDKYYQGNPVDKVSCYMSMAGGQSLANLLAALGGDKAPTVATPDPRVVRTTDSQHPAAQCRLDTMVAGAACAASWGDSVIPHNEKEMMANSCYTARDQSRPLCWYKPVLYK